MTEPKSEMERELASLSNQIVKIGIRAKQIAAEMKNKPNAVDPDIWDRFVIEVGAFEQDVDNMQKSLKGQS